MKVAKIKYAPNYYVLQLQVATITRIRSALDFATHTFFQNRGFLHVQVPIITTTDSEGFSEKFQVTTLLGRTSKKEEQFVGVSDADCVSLETVKAAIEEKSSRVEQLKRSDSNREALAIAIQDLRKTNELAQQIEAREKSKPVTAVKPDLVNFNEDFFGRQSYLTVSGRLHLESYACSLGHVYSFGPRFRADKTVSAKHVAEMWTVEVEMAFSELEVINTLNLNYANFMIISVRSDVFDWSYFFPGCHEMCRGLFQISLQMGIGQMFRRHELCLKKN